MSGAEFLDRLALVDPAFVAQADAMPAGRRGRLKWPVIAACIGLLILGAVSAMAAGGFGTRLISSFTGKQESGYSLSIELERISTDELTGDILEVQDIIKKQYEEFEVFSSSAPSQWGTRFETREEALTYIGLDGLKTLDWELEEQGTALSVCGNQEGQITSLTLETDYVEEQIRLYFFSDVYTENETGELSTGVAAAESVTFQESFYTTESGKQCHIIKGSAMESGYLCMDGYLVDGGILYTLHIAYLSADASRAEELMNQWADQF
ncbi:MAG: hypothetical protein LIO42_07250 [Oscillospiraceae bacterium]|nr:hypothetical protein [Oscillospiraceae bacterium]